MKLSEKLIVYIVDAAETFVHDPHDKSPNYSIDPYSLESVLRGLILERVPSPDPIYFDTVIRAPEEEEE